MAKPIVVVLIHDPALKTTNIKGPLGNRVVCLGILQDGIELVNQFHRQPVEAKEESRIVPATGLTIVPGPQGRN